MRNFRISHIVAAVVFGAYLATGILSPSNILVRTLLHKVDHSVSIQNNHSSDPDERPYWTSHKHLISTEKSSGDHLLGTAGPWTKVITPQRLIELPIAFIPISTLLFSSDPLRAPPLS